MRIATFFGCLGLLLGAAKGQAPAERVCVDAVVATVNDGAILLSELKSLAAGRISAAEARVGPLDAQEQARLLRREMEERINVHRMAQAAKTFGVYTPEQVEQLLRMELDHVKQEQLRTLGGTKLSQELQRQGRTWQLYEGEQRVETLRKFAMEFSVGRRLQKQSNLHLTPRRLRETYAKLKDQEFVRPADALLDIVLFRGKDAAADAARAAEIWRTEPLGSRELAARFAGATGLGEQVASRIGGELAEFGRAGPLDAVSAPLPVAGGFRVAKVVQYRPARNDRFEDPQVQAVLRQICELEVRKEFEKQALKRASDRTEVWARDVIAPGARR